MPVGAQMVIVLKAFVEHCVSLVLGHPFEFSWLEVSQTDVSHPFLLVPCDCLLPVTQSHRSSFCYKIVVRETEDRQLLHFCLAFLRGTLARRRSTCFGSTNLSIPWSGSFLSSTGRSKLRIPKPPSVSSPQPRASSASSPS